MEWEYFKPFDDLTDEEIKKLSVTEAEAICMKKNALEVAICMKKNAWEVASQVTALVDYERGPSKDYLQ